VSPPKFLIADAGEPRYEVGEVQFMSERSFEISDSDGARLRTFVAAIDAQLSCLGRPASAADHRTALDGLAVSWAGLIALLALGPAPRTRRCPACRSVGMWTATRCGYCWVALAPRPAAAAPEA
jgi:hypothetical protein